MTDLSVIITARNEIYLQRTIEDVLSNIQADTEIIAVCDGYWPEPPIQDHPRVMLIHHTEARGQRQSINEAARIAKGKYLMKLDAHCAVGPGFDRILIDDYQEGWTVVPRMYNLDVETWQPKLHKRTDYMYIGMSEGRELRAEYYERQPETAKEIDETMCCMGPGWFLSAETFWKQGGCDENHGSWGQQGVEVSLKAWLSGGALMVNKRTWFAHWFRGDQGFPYPISGREVEAARAYSRDLWLNNKWAGQVRDLRWMVEKFNPPGWDLFDIKKQLEINAEFYRHIHIKHGDTQYRGIQLIKMPTDLLLYHKVIWETRPDVIVEIGTKYGGSALYLQDQLDMLGNGGKVVTVDIKSNVANPDPRIHYLIGSSLDETIRGQIYGLTKDKRTMVVIDGNHHRVHVKWELKHYAPIVAPGCYMVIEDCYGSTGQLYGPGQARDWFLSVNKGFEQTNLDREFLIGYCVGGWVRKK